MPFNRYFALTLHHFMVLSTSWQRFLPQSHNMHQEMSLYSALRDGCVGYRQVKPSDDNAPIARDC